VLNNQPPERLGDPMINLLVRTNRDNSETNHSRKPKRRRLLPLPDQFALKRQPPSLPERYHRNAELPPARRAEWRINIHQRRMS